MYAARAAARRALTTPPLFGSALFTEVPRLGAAELSLESANTAQPVPLLQLTSTVRSEDVRYYICAASLRHEKLMLLSDYDWVGGWRIRSQCAYEAASIRIQ